MNLSMRVVPLALGLAALAGCVTVPTGPSVMVLPGDGRSFDQFRADDAECRNYAYYQSGGPAAENAQVDSAARSAILGTLIGAAAGAAINGSRGAGVGAGAGLAVGAAAGSGAAAQSGWSSQRRYDYAFEQCMYAKGNKVPGAARAPAYYPPSVGYAP